MWVCHYEHWCVQQMELMSKISTCVHVSYPLQREKVARIWTTCTPVCRCFTYIREKCLDPWAMPRLVLCLRYKKKPCIPRTHVMTLLQRATRSWVDRRTNNSLSSRSTCFPIHVRVGQWRRCLPTSSLLQSRISFHLRRFLWWLVVGLCCSYRQYRPLEGTGALQSTAKITISQN